MDDDDLLEYKQRSFNLRNGDMKSLSKIASKMNCKWNDKPAIGVMLKRIASGEFKVVKG